MLVGREDLAVGDLTLAEVLQGFDDDREFSTGQELLNALHVVDLAGQDICMQAARNIRAWRKAGVTVRKTIDTLIATRCIKSKYEPLHDDGTSTRFVKYLGLRAVA